MLIVSRKAGESFWIGNETEVIVMGCQGNNIRIGVRAPREVLILRTELKMVAQQNRAAVNPCSDSSINDLAARFRGPEA
jgi:carbon storage regulator